MMFLVMARSKLGATTTDSAMLTPPLLIPLDQDQYEVRQIVGRAGFPMPSSAAVCA
jgi:hypothetical protein